MKTPITLLYLFISITTFGQNTFGSPYIKFYQKNEEPYYYNKKLGLTDKDAVVIASRGVTEVGSCNSYLVLLSDGSMFKYGVNNNTNPPEVRKKEVTDSIEKLKFLVIIDVINSLYRFNASDPLSYAYWKELEKDVDFIILDGNYYSIEVTQGKKIATYFSYAAETYIDNKVPGLELKQQFVRVISKLDFSAELFQPFKISEMNFQQNIKDVDYKVRGLLNENAGAVVIKSKIIDQNKIKESFIVLQPDGGVFFYTPDDIKYLKKKEIIGNYRIYVVSWIKQINSLDPSLLSATNEKTQEENKGLTANDRVMYILEIYKDDAYSKFESYVPQAYIEEKLPGYEMHEKLLNMMRSFDFAKNM